MLGVAVSEKGANLAAAVAGSRRRSCRLLEN